MVVVVVVVVVFRNAAREILTTAKLHMSEEMENIGGERVPVQVERSGLDECEWYNLFCCPIYKSVFQLLLLALTFYFYKKPFNLMYSCFFV